MSDNELLERLEKAEKTIRELREDLTFWREAADFWRIRAWDKIEMQQQQREREKRDREEEYR